MVILRQVHPCVPPRCTKRLTAKTRCVKRLYFRVGMLALVLSVTLYHARWYRNPQSRHNHECDATFRWIGRVADPARP